MEVKINKRAFYRKLITLTLPIALQSLMLALVAACDALMLGKVEQNEMTAVSLATQVQFVQNMFVFAVTGAGAVLGAQYWGKRDREKMQEIFDLMLVLSGMISLIFFLACEFIPVGLMHIFSKDKVIIEIGAKYLQIAGWSYLITGISQCYLTMMKITDRVIASAVASSVAVVLNIVLNYIFIFGKLGLPAMNSRGAAIATMIARVMEMLLSLGFTLGKEHIRPALGKLFKIDKELAKSFVKQLLPLMGGSLLWGVGFTSYTAIIGHMNSDAAAANSIASVVRDLICCICNGIGSAAGIMVGNEMGAGRLETGKAYGIKLKNISYIIGFISTGLVLAVTPIVVSSMELTEEARSYLTGMMIIMSIYMIGRCVNTVSINGVLDGGGDTVFDMYSLFVTMWCIAVPLALLGAFVFHFPVLVVYACTCLDEVGKIPWVMYRIKKYKWVKNLTVTNNP
ncbi:MAG: MATE family efflux transporter [Lachnospiraceae bacterium]|nr:MATE family efflux transporter [Lachnospiraceae bacterium]